jgi:predicted nucleic acid-binding protein
MLAQVDELVLQAPAIFDWEVRNVLLTFERRGSLQAKSYDEALLFHADLNVTLHELNMALGELSLFARARRLSLFDAAYLAWALERAWPLASRDDALLKVAAASGVECFDLRGPAA